MLTPRIPVNPLPTGSAIPLDQTTAIHPVVVEHPAPASPCGCQHHTPAFAAVQPPAPKVARFTPGQLAALVGGGAAVALVVGAVLVSMLLAVAITGASVAVCAVVLRSLLNDTRRPLR
ncbi:SpdD-like protein [Streptomyces tirandamycinicus]|uniref:SpdD-like protein n=1 Tax=Streptomyces tirandamycinicus TaxID=2174846 RepID=UPI00226FD211|nr:SpdD-like protein [Streptomyces tirandamycinicus]MCY0980415.1 SpdD-like protein [Streptomyces tirandamycinicus]